MGADECWETFLVSGKVTDYLDYKKQEQLQREYDAGFQAVPSDRCGDDTVQGDTNAGFY